MDLWVVVSGVTLGFVLIAIYEFITHVRYQRFRRQLHDQMAAQGQDYINQNLNDPFVQAVKRFSTDGIITGPPRYCEVRRFGDEWYLREHPSEPWERIIVCEERK